MAGAWSLPEAALMGWAIMLVLAAAATGIVSRYAGLSRSGLEWAGATVLLALAGYTWQGRPGQQGVAVAERVRTMPPEDTAAIATRRAMSGPFTGEYQTVDFADTLIRLGLTRQAVIAVKTGLRRAPNSADLWVALGNALVAHGGGRTSAAAEYAFLRAGALSPDHPAPPFFEALALAKSGRTEEAARIWQGLLARAPKDAPWRRDIEARLAQVGPN